ncbi:patatin-like phospholipase family protein [Microbacterium maritypicum]
MLGGAGSAGNAWVIGVVAGLRDGGVDATDVDLVVGTSAGSTAAAQLTTGDPAALLAEILDAHAGSAPPPGRRGAPPVDHRARTAAIIAGSRNLPDMRRRLGAEAMALEGSTDMTVRDRWRSIVASRLPSPAEWPAQRFVVTAVDARTGEPVLFDSDSGVALVDAVAASCSSGTAYAIGEGFYLDGGYRANSDNADLAEGHERVLVLSPFGGRARIPREWGAHLEDHVAALRAAGSRVATVLPDAEAVAAFGENVMDPASRMPAARAGFAQGRALASTVRALWT